MGDLATTYDVHLGLTGKRILDFLIMSTELFSPRVTAEALLAKQIQNLRFLSQCGHFDPTFQVEVVASHQ